VVRGQGACAFEVFKVYKSWAENQLRVKIRALQDDKGGEYMSKAFLAFTEQCGIERRHSTRNRPQQNGLAERANRTMSERITAMLSESRLPPSFWGECISSMVHVWNRLPTASLSGTTPFQAFYKRSVKYQTRARVITRELAEVGGLGFNLCVAPLSVP
jgi:transposase InsO family protein